MSDFLHSFTISVECMDSKGNPISVDFGYESDRDKLTIWDALFGLEGKFEKVCESRNLRDLDVLSVKIVDNNV